MIDETEIKNIGREVGIDQLRISSPAPFPETAKIIQGLKRKGYYLSNEYLLKIDTEYFCNIETRFPWAKSIIICALGYLTDEKLPQSGNGPYGLIARFTWRNNYLILKRKLKKLARFLKENFNAQCRIFSNGPIPEKPIAQRSGLGYYGKNGLIINHKFGSWMVLGEIVTDLELKPDPPIEDNCGECNKCIIACPTRAIIKPYIIDSTRCIQALSGWYGPVPEPIARVWGNRLYGCTTCQDVCPKNSTVKPHPPESEIGYVGPGLSLLKILNFSEDEFRSNYAKNQLTASWVDFRAIKRNALICLGNTKDKGFLPLLKKFTDSSDPVLARTAQWAIKNLNNG